MIGATDMGTGCDTILTQMAAECLECEMEDIVVHGVIQIIPRMTADLTHPVRHMLREWQL